MYFDDIMFILYYETYIIPVIHMSTLHDDVIIFCIIYILVIYWLWYGYCKIEQVVLNVR